MSESSDFDSWFLSNFFRWLQAQQWKLDDPHTLPTFAVNGDIFQILSLNEHDGEVHQERSTAARCGTILYTSFFLPYKNHVKLSCSNVCSSAPFKGSISVVRVPFRPPLTGRSKIARAPGAKALAKELAESRRLIRKLIMFAKIIS